MDCENRSHVVVPEKSVAKDETKKQKKDTVYNDSWSWTQLFGSFFAYLCDRAYCLLGLGEKKASWHLLTCKKFDLCSLVYC